MDTHCGPVGARRGTRRRNAGACRARGRAHAQEAKEIIIIRIAIIINNKIVITNTIMIITTIIITRTNNGVIIISRPSTRTSVDQLSFAFVE